MNLAARATHALHSHVNLDTHPLDGSDKLKSAYQAPLIMHETTRIGDGQKVCFELNPDLLEFQPKGICYRRDRRGHLRQR